MAAPELCPEVALHLADLDQLWAQQEAWLGQRGLPAPYWAVAWPGGQAIARYVLDHPQEVRGRRVLDLGCGSAICAIAAARSGAAHVDAADIDEYARLAARANARLNAVSFDTPGEDLVGTPLRWDVVLVGDLFYERFLAVRLGTWLRAAAHAGATVLVGDHGRAFLPRSGLVELDRYAIRASQSLEAGPVTMTGVWRFAPR